jgi:NCAIR mutase (PurE)-related protein
MTNGSNNGDRLNIIEAIVESNSRLLQAMLEQSATDRLKRKEKKAEHEERMRLLEETQRELVRTSSGIARLLTSIDEDRPTIWRRLMTIENKVDRILERE